MAKKTKTTTKKATDGSTPALSFSKPQALDSVKFAAWAKRGSQYDALFEQMKGLKEGQTIVVAVPADAKGVKQDSRIMHNRINAAMRRTDLAAPKGCVFEKKTTESGDVAICCVKAPAKKSA